MYDIDEKEEKIYYVLFFLALLFVLAILPYFLDKLPPLEENRCKDIKDKKANILPFEK